jgi:hypothetical protein
MMTDAEVAAHRCARCLRASVSAYEVCDDCRRVLEAKLWRRFAEGMMRGLPEEDRKTIH